MIAYWFFFALRPAATPHEGAWESVTVMIPDDGTEVGVRFDSPRGALTCGIGETQLAHGTHPVAYVEPGSHGLFRSPEDVEGGRNDTWTGLHSWELEAVRVPTQAWSSFDGAWGRVGPGPRSTGSLGPLFRREAADAMLLP